MIHILFTWAITASALQLSSRQGPEDVCRGQVGASWNRDCCPRTLQIPPPPEPDVKLRVILAEPCSGSSAVETVAMEILQLANVRLAKCNGHGEVLKDLESGYNDMSGRPLYQNYSLQPEQLGDYLKVLMDANAAQGRSLVIKDPDRRVLHNTEVADLIRKNGKATFFIRANLIDSFLCQIKDGMDVFSCATAAELGTCTSCGEFRGRGANETAGQERLTLNTEKLLEALFELSLATNDKAFRAHSYFGGDDNSLLFNHDERNLANELAELCDSPKATMNEEEFEKNQALAYSYSHSENLLGYEWDSSLVENSVTEWQKFLKELGSDIDANLIRSYLTSNTGSFSPPSSHREEIENYQDVKETFSTCKAKFPWAWCDRVEAMLRD